VRRISGRRDGNVRHWADELGFDGYLAKPVGAAARSCALTGLLA
jgi:hypothetical protein